MIDVTPPNPGQSPEQIGANCDLIRQEVGRVLLVQD